MAVIWVVRYELNEWMYQIFLYDFFNEIIKVYISNETIKFKQE